MFRPSWSGWRATRQAYGEHRPFARFARHGHVAAHHAGELAREGKAEPRSAVAPRGQGIGLGEFLKKFRLLFGGQADAGIRDGKLDPVTSVRGGASGNRTEPAGRKVLRHQLHNLLPQANGVALALLAISIMNLATVVTAGSLRSTSRNCSRVLSNAAAMASISSGPNTPASLAKRGRIGMPITPQPQDKELAYADLIYAIDHQAEWSSRWRGMII